MFEFKMGYRHANGQVEGFKATRFSRYAAEVECRNQIRLKCEQIGDVYQQSREIHADYDLSKEEIRQIKQDWRSNWQYA